MIRLLVSLLMCLPVSPLRSAAARGGSAPRIRVAIVLGSPAIRLRTSAKIYVEEMKTGEKYQLLGKASYEIGSAGGAISISGQKLSSPVKLMAAEGGDHMRLAGRLYKGDILLKASGAGRIDIIESLSLEDYLCGVLPAEMSPDWPLEALKAQAVASRTYALKQINPAKDYDITDGVEMQVYKGSAVVSPRITEAVNSTRGQVLRYRNKLVTAFFHACCGGHTAAVNSAWGEEVIKPLYGIVDPFCKESNHYRWSLFVSSRDLLTFIQTQGSTALKITGIKAAQKDRSGRLISLKFSTDQGSTTALVKELRKAVGTYEFRSTYLTRITPAKNGYDFEGRGWGHGVGMCQDGAKVMAFRGRSYKKILRHYYPGAAIEDI